MLQRMMDAQHVRRYLSYEDKDMDYMKFAFIALFLGVVSLSVLVPLATWLEKPEIISLVFVFPIVSSIFFILEVINSL